MASLCLGAESLPYTKLNLSETDGDPDFASAVVAQRQQRRLFWLWQCLAFIGGAVLAICIVFTFAHSEISRAISYNSHYTSSDMTRFSTEMQESRKSHAKGYHVIMMVSQPNEMFCRSLFAFLANGYPAPYLPHYKQPIKGGFLAKIETFEGFARKHSADNATLVLVDGYDVWAQLSFDVLVERYRNLGRDIVLGADKLCFPNKWETDACQKMPPSVLPHDVYGPGTDKPHDGIRTRPRFLNSGFIMGTSKAMQEILEKTYKLMKADSAAGRGVNDQGSMAEVLVKTDNAFTYSIDTRIEFVQTMIWSEHDVIWEVNPDPATPNTIPTANSTSQLQLPLAELKMDTAANREKSFYRDLPLARNFVANSIPALLHWAGPDKKKADPWWPRPWYMQEGIRDTILEALRQETQPGGAGVWSRDQWIPWRDVCGPFPLF